MSFLGDLVNSIGTSKAPPLHKPPTQPVSRTTISSISSNAAPSNSAPQPKISSSAGTPPVTGLKRKLDERETKPSQPSERAIKPNPAPGLTSKVNQKPGFKPPNGVKPSLAKGHGNSELSKRSPTSSSLVNPSVTATSSGASATASKPVAKGSYAEMMARAKEAQLQRAQNLLGTIKHQATSKEKVSKLAERRRQEQEKLKAEKVKRTEKNNSNLKTADRKRGGSPVKKSENSKVLRAPRPPLHAPVSSTYKGTMGIQAKKPRDARAPRHTRYDEYLGTDEEDNSDIDGYDDDDGYGYGSDGSSDMEAGLNDIDMEESAALRAGKEEDARELAYENQLKREKEERKRRLQAMARKR